MSGRPLAAARNYEQLLRQYPNSPQRLDARRWLDAHQEELERARAARRQAADPAEGGGGEGEVVEDPAAGGEEGAGAADAADRPDPPGEEGPVAVQLGAFSSLERARTLADAARSEGVEGLRIVRVEGSGLVRVRKGRFPSREAAADLRSRIAELGYDATVVTDADRESAIR